MFVQSPVRCFKCHKFNHTASTCHANQDTCGLCEGRHRTCICVAKRKADQEVKLMCSNCKGNHCTVSNAHTEERSYSNHDHHKKFINQNKHSRYIHPKQLGQPDNQLTGNHPTQYMRTLRTSSKCYHNSQQWTIFQTHYRLPGE